MQRGPDLDPHALLRRVLTLEQQQGYADRAAIGGLATLALQQVDRAEGAADRDRLQAAAAMLRSYAETSRPRRQQLVDQVLTVLSSDTRPAVVPRRSEPRPRAAPRVEVAANAPRARPTGERRAASHADLATPLAELKGTRTQMAEVLESVGVRTVRDLLYYFPRAHYDYTDRRSVSRLRFGEKSTLVGTIENVRTSRTGRGIVVTTAAVSDDSGTAAVRWFNQPYLAKQLPVGARVAISGQADLFNGYLTFVPRDFELIHESDLVHAGRLVPVYPLTKGLFQRSLRSYVRRVLDACVDAMPDPLPPDVKHGRDLMPLPDAVRQYHFPDDEGARDAARQRLAFDELLLVQLGMLQRKRAAQVHVPEMAIPVNPSVIGELRDALTFQLTGAQERVIGEILADLGRATPMSRLLQGDVGSGKTVVAAAAMLAIARSGRQAVLMAPTEILAEQHHSTLSRLLAPLGVRIALLTGSTRQAERRKVLADVQTGQTHVLVGTHALIQEGVEFCDLALAVTDEQHRFGVEQRGLLRQKGHHPHTLSMTATPIPRTLAMTLYGDLDVSTLDEMPLGRLPVITTLARTPSEAYGMVRDEVRRGHQAFVICPVIEESADADMRSAQAEHRELRDVIFPDVRVGLLHGRMKSREKERVLSDFRDGTYGVLVATSVVEVGIDVPNATIMVIRDAHRFGLAQLHQFRGRVGRGREQSYCVLLSPSDGESARERLDALTATDDGFALAEEDLRLRGPGEFWGTRQSGLPVLQVATLADMTTLEQARTLARALLDQDPELSRPDHHVLRESVKRFWAQSADIS